MNSAFQNPLPSLAVVEQLLVEVLPLLDRGPDAVDGFGIGVRPLEEAAVAADDVVLAIAGQLLERAVAEDDGAVVLVRVGQDHRHPAHLHGGVEDIVAAMPLPGRDDVAPVGGVVVQVGGVQVGSLRVGSHRRFLMAPQTPYQRRDGPISSEAVTGATNRRPRGCNHEFFAEAGALRQEEQGPSHVHYGG